MPRKTFFWACFALMIFAGIAQAGSTLLFRGTGAAGPTPECSETFTTGDTDDVATNSMFETETDASSLVQIVSNCLRIDVGTVNNIGYVVESSCLSGATEVTIKFKMSFEDIANVANGIDNVDFQRWMDSTNSDWVGLFRLNTNAGNTIDNYTAYRGLLVEAGNVVTMTGLAADTWYDCYVYAKIHATTGGTAIKIGAWDESNTGFNDDTTAAADADLIHIGVRDGDWGDSTTDTFIHFDDIQIFLGDER